MRLEKGLDANAEFRLKWKPLSKHQQMISYQKHGGEK
jgi:hypothetical protein